MKYCNEIRKMELSFALMDGVGLLQRVHNHGFILTSNNVEIAFGMDVDGDGTLCDDEVSLSAGWDCGEWFIMNVATGERFADIGANGPHELNGGILLRADGRVRSVAFCDDTTPLFNTLSISAKSWKFPAPWNTARLVGRGDNIRSGERFYMSATPQGFAIRLQ